MQIRFSHDYPKLWGQKKAELLAVKIILAEVIQANKKLLNYDTKFITRDLLEEYYPLPKSGHLLQLVFLGDEGIPFCTIRTMTPEKYKYYSSAVGKEFSIILTGDD